MTNTERMAYYEPFTVVKSNSLKIYAIKDSIALKSAFEDFSNFPHIMAKDIVSGKTYQINCYDDISGQIQDINSGILTSLLPVHDSVFNKTTSYFKNKARIVYTKTETSTQPRWELYLVSGTFLGPKLRSRTLPIIHLDNIATFEILDLSIDISN